MTRKRSELGGGTDYTGISLQDIYAHFGEWCESTNALVQKLINLKSKVTENKKKIDHVYHIIEFIDLSIDLFSRFLSIKIVYGVK